MIQQVKKSKFKKTLSIYLALMILLETLQPMRMYALTSGPTQPEFNAFTPIGTSDMVSLSSGDFNYNIPIMDVGGYPLNLAYTSGVTMDQEASWVGLGWNLNVGQISRQVRGLPDDFRGDEMHYENDLKDNITVGANFNFHPAFAGVDGKKAPGPVTFGLGVQYNNYEGISFKPSLGVSFEIAKNVRVGANFSSSVGEGASVNPSVTISQKMTNTSSNATNFIEGTGTLGLGFDSRKGLGNLNISASVKNNNYVSDNVKQQSVLHKSSGSVGGSLSLNNSQNYTPTKRVGYDNRSFTFNAAIGSELFLGEGQGQITGYGCYQGISKVYKDRYVKAYGYENTQYKGKREGVLDFNREKEQTVSRNTTALPITNYTYDTYSIEGQGISGMFRPYRSQVSHLYNDEITDNGIGVSAGAEFGAGNLVHVGVNFLASPSTSSTGKWVTDNPVLPLFSESNTDVNEITYEPVSFKLIGELDVDKESNIYENEVYTNKAMRLKLDKSRYNNKTSPILSVKNGLNSNDYLNHDIKSPIKRKQRYLRNQVIQKITNKDAVGDPFIVKSNIVRPSHHTAGVKVLQADGSTYVYGKSLYNTKKVEATFDVSGKSATPNITSTGILSGITSIRGNNGNNSDQFLNRVTTPAYAHTFLITSILSADYEDLDGNGPTENDLGTYTKFEYKKMSDNFKWRVPYKSTDVSYNEGLKSNTDDEKGNYIYGEKELSYLKKIITKTHVAIFTMSQREDARGAKGEINDEDEAGYTYKIDKISLYSLPEAKAANLLDNDESNDLVCSPIKTAHFDYTYELCKGTPNNFSAVTGKLTLKKLYFTYRNSNMGKYTPYKFDYGIKPDENGSENLIDNPKYDLKGFDVWGNYKPNQLNPIINPQADPSSTLNNSEFPFVEQNKEKADSYTAVWVLKSIKLPSGGTIAIKTESDDYQYVQDKKAMQMFKVVGAGNEISPTDDQLKNTQLYNGNTHCKYIYVDLGILNETLDDKKFKDKYLSEQTNKSIYFRFLLNMNISNAWQKDYVNGYFNINDSIGIVKSNNITYAAIPLQTLDRDGGLAGKKQVNPIAKAGWGFGRMYMNRIVYSIGGNSNNTSFVPIVKDLLKSLSTISELWKGPNKALQDKGCAKNFDGKKSWIRLENPDGHKYGGGLRVKSIELSDNWDVMTAHGSNPIYNQKYGQTYDYNLNDGKSSGVATYEPNSSPENPFVEPFYPNTGNYADRIAAPKDQNYIEKPFGEAFFPSSTITYSQVTVSNLSRQETEGSVVSKVTKHATGKVVTTHYTSRDFPTIVDYTDIDMAFNPEDSFTSFFDILSISHIAATQGFSIETNDMNGKLKSQEVYAEGNIKPISGVDYFYDTDQDKKLDNKLTTINSKGKVEKHLIGVEYDVINDFNESNSQSQSYGFDGNLAAFIIAFFPGFAPTILPKVSIHESVLRTAVTTKVTHKTGILIEKVAYDLGSSISTKNLAWDANTGQILLTQTINEFNDKYYSFNYPAYWNYENMGLASENIDLKGTLKETVNNGSYFHIQQINSFPDISKYFKLGDELVFNEGNQVTKLWVAEYDGSKTHVKLMNKEGVIINSTNKPFNLNFKIVRSGNRNLQMASMASVTSMINPIDTDDNPDTVENITGTTFLYDTSNATTSNKDSKIINASAVQYSDVWKSQCENNLPNEFGLINAIGLPVNPYLYNTKGDWRPVKSYAYLTGRNNFVTSNRRNAGCFTSFIPFYKLTGEENAMWSSADHQKWTYASEITKYNPYGVELENKDALDRYSSAQYGYNYKLPMAVASNAQYNEMGFDGFEDYDPTLYLTPSLLKPHFGFKQDVNSNAFVTDETSHTGNSSIAITPGNKVTFKRKIGGCKTPTIPKQLTN